VRQRMLFVLVRGKKKKEGGGGGGPSFSCVAAQRGEGREWARNQRSPSFVPVGERNKRKRGRKTNPSYKRRRTRRKKEDPAPVCLFPLKKEGRKATCSEEKGKKKGGKKTATSVTGPRKEKRRDKTP